MTYAAPLHRLLPLLAALATLAAAAPARAAVSLVVDTTGDEADATPGDGTCATAAGACSLRAALTEVIADAQGGTIGFAVAVDSTLTLAAPLPTVTRPLVLDGAGSPGLSLSRNLTAASAAGGLLALAPGAGAQVELRNLRLAGAKLTGSGGAVLVTAGSLRAVRVVFENNTASVGGGALAFAGGGALELIACAFSSNTAAWGGAIRLTGGTLMLENGFLYSNQATQEGGAISLGGGGAVTVRGTTLVSNLAFQGTVATRGGAIAVDHGSATALLLRQVTVQSNNARAGGGLSLGSTGAVTLENSALAGNFASFAGQEPDCEGAVTSATHSLLGASGGSCAVTHGVAGNLVGSVAAPIDPLVQLDWQGLSTATLVMPQLGSPLREAGDAAVCALADVALDPRGVARSPGSDGDGDGTPACDIGAAEAPAPGAPTIIDFNATRSTLTEGESTSLNWNAVETLGCTIGDGSAAAPVAVAAQGNLQVTPAATTVYTLTCPGVGVAPPAAAVAQVTVFVTPAPVVAITSFSATPAAIAPGGSTLLAWTEENSAGCDLSDGTSSEYVPSYGGGSITKSPSATTTYTLTCNGNRGPASASVTVTVGSAPPPVQITSFAATPASITAGGGSTLAWTVTDATACEISGGAAPVSAPPPAGSLAVTPAVDTTYTLTCQGSGGPVSASATVTVTPAPSGAIASFTATLLGSFGDPARPYARYSLAWDAPNADVCRLWTELGGLSSPLGASGSGEEATATTVQLRCDWGSAQEIATLALHPPPNFTDLPPATSIYAGESYQLIVGVSAASTCDLDGVPHSVHQCGTGLCFRDTLLPTETTTYAFTCRGPDPLLVATASFTLTVETVKSSGSGCSTPGTSRLPLASLLALVGLGLWRSRRRTA